MSDVQQPLILKDFQLAVADSPHLGHALMNNIDIEAFPGAMKVQKQFSPQVATTNSGLTFTANAATDVCTGSATLVPTGGNGFASAAVTFTTTGTLPAGLSLATTYFLISVSTNTFKVATTRANADAGTAIDITDAGTGVHTIVPVPIGTFKHIRKDSRTGYYFAQDTNGRVWNTQGGTAFHLLAGNTLTNGYGNGISLFRTADGAKTWLFVFRAAVIDYIEVTGNTQIDTPVWTSAWQSLNTTAGTDNTHYAIVGQDNITYFVDARFVGSIIEKAGSVFDPTNAATYTFNNQALDMPQDEINVYLEELGVNLLVAGSTYNKIYPWDRISDSFSLPIPVPEVGISKMKNLGNTVYILAGGRGNIYTTQGTYCTLFKRIPSYIANGASVITGVPITWGGIGQRNGALLFGMTSQVTGNSGVYILYPDGRLLMENTPYGGSQQVHTIFADNDLYLIGYAGSIDYPSTSALPIAGTYAAVYHSQLFRIANKTEKAAYSNLEVQLAKPATTGQIRIKYRFDDSSSWSNFPSGAVVFSCDGTVTSFEQDIGLIDVENLQVQVEFDANVELMQVALIP